MPEKRLTYRGVTMNQRTKDMFIAAELIADVGTLVLTQGSYNAGGVAASGGTHDGGGALDIRAKDLAPTERTKVVTALRRVGFAAWIRNPSQSDWPWHIHGIAIGDPDLSRGARDQVADYKAGRNGLASNGRDDATRAWVSRTWEIFVEVEMEQLLKEIKALRTELAAVKSALAAHDAKETGRYGRLEAIYKDLRGRLG
jgi:hypothetical protein